MIVTGNVQVAADHLTLGADMIVPTVLTPQSCEPFRKLANCVKGDSLAGNPADAQRTMIVMQLSHTGRQAATFLGGRLPFSPPLAPSATRVGAQAKEGFIARLLYRLLFQTAKEMSADDIEGVVDGFVRGALLAVQSGFDGVQLHASHGCEFFLSVTSLAYDNGIPFRSIGSVYFP